MLSRGDLKFVGLKYQFQKTLSLAAPLAPFWLDSGNILRDKEYWAFQGGALGQKAA